MKNNKYLKILAGATALLLTGGIIVVATAMIGNPVSASRARNKAEIYIKETYTDKDFVIEGVTYNFKDGSYWIKVRSDQSRDTHFNVFFRSGAVYGDDFDFRVSSGLNTIERFCQEYSQRLTSLVKPKTDRVTRLTVIPDRAERYSVELDSEFDMKYFEQAAIFLDVKGEADSAQMAEIVRLTWNTLKENGYSIDNISISDEKGKTLMSLKPEHFE